MIIIYFQLSDKVSEDIKDDRGMIPNRGKVPRNMGKNVKVTQYFLSDTAITIPNTINRGIKII